MKHFKKYVISAIFLLVCLLTLSVFGASAATEDASAASVPHVTSASELTSAINLYKQNNPSAAQHRITANHKVVYDADAYFKDMVNATTSNFSCYAKLGSDDLVSHLSGLGVSVQLRADSSAAAEYEILVGIVDRTAQQSFLPMVDVNEFGIMVTEKQIILLAWQDVALKTCVDIFKSYLTANTLTLPVGFVATGVADSKWKVDFPRPTGADIALTAGQFVNDDSLQFLYTGAGATRDAYFAYCTQLVSAGFSLVWQNTVGNNEFRMYQNTARGTALYVAYNDFTYAAEFDALYQANYGTADDAFAPKFEKCFRIVSSPLSSVTLPDATINSPQPYTKVTDTYMTTIGLAAEKVGAGYVIMLEDGRFVVIDGGKCKDGTGGSFWCTDVRAIWDTMIYLYNKAYGTKNPTAQRPIHVAAWYLTHGHADHYTSFQRMIHLIGNDASKKAIFKLDYVIANLPGEGSIFTNTSTQWGYNDNADLRVMQSKVPFQYIKVHTGQRLYFANLMIEVLMTYEDHLPLRIANTNDTNTITRFHIRSSGAATNSTVTSLDGNAVTVMFLGDSWRPAGRYLCAMYGTYLHSDISQISHHGNIGAEQELYATIAPKGVLFSNDKDAFLGYVWKNATSTNPEARHAYAVDQYVVRGTTLNGKTLNSVEYVWSAPGGTWTTLQFTADGAQYDSAFDLITGKKITYTDINLSAAQSATFISIKRTHAHDYGTVWQKHSATQHKSICSCGAEQYADHTWNSGVITTPATHYAIGSKTLTCTACTETKVVDVPKLTAHEYGGWEQHSATEHKRTCPCDHIDYQEHTWGAETVTTPATHLTLGAATQTCTACSETKEIELPKLAAHEYGGWEQHSTTEHKRTCPCGEVESVAHAWEDVETLLLPSHTTPGIKKQSCPDCEKTAEVAVPALEGHSFGEWVTVVAPEVGKEGKRERVCACGESLTETLPALEGVKQNTAEQNGAGVNDSVSEADRSLGVGVWLALIGGPILAFVAGFALCLTLNRKKRTP